MKEYRVKRQKEEVQVIYQESKGAVLRLAVDKQKMLGTHFNLLDEGSLIGRCETVADEVIIRVEAEEALVPVAALAVAMELFK